MLPTTQEIRFDKSKIIENKEKIESNVGYKPSSIQFYYFTDKSITTDALDRTYPLKLKFKIINEDRDLERAMPNVFLTKLFKRDDSKTAISYRNKVLSNNILDKHMQRFSPVTYILLLYRMLSYGYV